MTPVVVILGASALAYGYQRRSGLALNLASIPFRRANAGRRLSEDQAHDAHRSGSRAFSNRLATDSVVG